MNSLSVSMIETCEFFSGYFSAWIYFKTGATIIKMQVSFKTVLITPELLPFGRTAVKTEESNTAPITVNRYAFKIKPPKRTRIA